jgi:hypothetical protein
VLLLLAGALSELLVVLVEVEILLQVAPERPVKVTLEERVVQPPVHMLAAAVAVLGLLV